MAVVFVHGVPETTRVWDELRPRLGGDAAVALSLPGFGCPLPDGFEPTMEGYAAWLAAELEAFDDVDLVTHDWGALLSIRVLADRPANVRSWVCDVGDLAPDFRWHDLALTWQQPGEGEALMDSMLSASPEDRAALLVASGVPEAGAAAMAAHFDGTMAGAILTLYRSATDIGGAWGPCIDRISTTALVIESMQDPFRAPHRARRLAERIGAEVAPLPDAGHWWMLDSPAQAATVVAGFWAGL